MTEDQIKHMVDRFLSWKLPADFNPDGGVSFKKTFNDHLPTPSKHEPSGTNLLDAMQATTMVRHMLEGLPPSSAGTAEPSMEDLRRTNVELMAKLKESHQHNLALWEAIAGGPEPRCRDCADFDGRCQGNGLPCDPQERALEQIKRLRALPQSLPSRDEIARIIDPGAKFQDIDGVKWSKFEIQRRDLAYLRADEVLAACSVTRPHGASHD